MVNIQEKVNNYPLDDLELIHSRHAFKVHENQVHVETCTRSSGSYLLPKIRLEKYASYQFCDRCLLEDDVDVTGIYNPQGQRTYFGSLNEILALQETTHQACISKFENIKELTHILIDTNWLTEHNAQEDLPYLWFAQLLKLHQRMLPEAKKLYGRVQEEYEKTLIKNLPSKVRDEKALSFNPTERVLVRDNSFWSMTFKEIYRYKPGSSLLIIPIQEAEKNHFTNRGRVKRYRDAVKIKLTDKKISEILELTDGLTRRSDPLSDAVLKRNFQAARALI